MCCLVLSRITTARIDAASEVSCVPQSSHRALAITITIICALYVKALFASAYSNEGYSGKGHMGDGFPLDGLSSCHSSTAYCDPLFKMTFCANDTIDSYKKEGCISLLAVHMLCYYYHPRYWYLYFTDSHPDREVPVFAGITASTNWWMELCDMYWSHGIQCIGRKKKRDIRSRVCIALPSSPHTEYSQLPSFTPCIRR